MLHQGFKVDSRINIILFVIYYLTATLYFFTKIKNISWNIFNLPYEYLIQTIFPYYSNNTGVMLYVVEVAVEMFFNLLPRVQNRNCYLNTFATLQTSLLKFTLSMLNDYSFLSFTKDISEISQNILSNGFHTFWSMFNRFSYSLQMIKRERKHFGCLLRYVTCAEYTVETWFTFKPHLQWIKCKQYIFFNYKGFISR